ncbi:hypothetical protein [Peromfec virus RodF8_26]|uniref:Uncharacterized protein n=1 Tax=Peromfec virus RodF8_26 TaxID=2929365 RepID=A0A976R7R4_9VIRU|nr:hypothetical protein [Peromfec virus RodF8_26]
MIPQGKKFTAHIEKPESVGYSCKDACYHKYGKDIPVSEYIKAGKDGTIAKEIINDASGLRQLENKIKDIPNADITIDLNEDLYSINKKLKCGQIAERRIKLEIEKMKKLKQDQENETKGE